MPMGVPNAVGHKLTIFPALPTSKGRDSERVYTEPFKEMDF
jgi:hypothetical protein